MAQPVNIQLPQSLGFLVTEQARYKVAFGGRGGAKSHSFGRATLIRAVSKPTRVLCLREYQTSIRDSVHKLLKDLIVESGLSPYFDVQRDVIRSTCGSEYMFKGLHNNAQEIKSTEGIDIAWLTEATNVADDSWQYLIPTVRKPGSEIWVDYNPDQETDATHQRMVVNQPFPETSLDPDERAIVRKVGWQDNPWFPSVLDGERRRMLNQDPDAYDWVWEGNCRKISAAQIFRNRWVVEPFDEPEAVRPFYGGDWGFADDPSAFVRCYIKDECLYITHEAFDYRVELDDLPALMSGGRSSDGLRVWTGVPGIRDWPIKADSARPETISYVARQGFAISAADKWPGSVEDGVEHLKAFRQIFIHPRCVQTAQEFRLYKYKTDRVTGDILPIIMDKHNHVIDALRYALDGYIQRRGNLGVWARLGAE